MASLDQKHRLENNDEIIHVFDNHSSLRTFDTYGKIKDFSFCLQASSCHSQNRTISIKVQEAEFTWLSVVHSGHLSVYAATILCHLPGTGFGKGERFS